MFTSVLPEAATIPAVVNTKEERIELEQLRPTHARRQRLAVLVVLAAALFVAFAAPHWAKAGVAGQQGAWQTEFGTEPGQLYNPKLLGVDPIDGSVYISGNSPNFEEAWIDKFSPTGTLEGTVSIPRAAETSGAEGRRSFIGIAVDHQRGLFYLLQNEAGVRAGEPTGTRTATKILAFKTTPQAGALVPATTPTLPLPDPEGSEALIQPQEMAVDPSDGDLVISAHNPAGQVILQRIGNNGSTGARYTETQSTPKLIVEPQSEGKDNFGFVVGEDGTTYVVAENVPVEAFELSPAFASATLVAVPGFVAAGAREGWAAGGQGFFSAGSYGNGEGNGPQVALSRSASGEETLYWKIEVASPNGNVPGNLLIHGFSLQQEATTAAYGGTETEGTCDIQSFTAGIAGTTADSLVVFDQGPEVAEESESPAYGLKLFHFGPGGGRCPAPAAAIAFKSGASTVTSAPPGSTVTLDGAGSELGGLSVAGSTWTITGPGGTETLSGTGSSLELNHQFTTLGEYTVGLDIKFSTAFPRIGTHFDAKPTKLMITNGGGGGTPAPTVSSLSPAGGPAGGGTVVTITGTELTGATAVNFGTAAATSVTPVSATSLKATSPAGMAGSKVPVTVVTPGGTSATGGAGDEFSYQAAVTTHALTIIRAGTGSGAVSCNGTTCAGAYPAGTPVTLTAAAVAGSTFVGWSGGGCSGTGSCALTLNADTSVTATFNKAAVVPGGGTGTGTGTGTGSATGTGSSGGGSGPGSGAKTKAQMLREERAKALAKCKKLSGKPKAECVKKANQIGKPKKHGHKKKHGKAAHK